MLSIPHHSLVCKIYDRKLVWLQVNCRKYDKKTTKFTVTNQSLAFFLHIRKELGNWSIYYRTGQREKRILTRLT